MLKKENTMENLMQKARLLVEGDSDDCTQSTKNELLNLIEQFYNLKNDSVSGEDSILIFDLLPVGCMILNDKGIIQNINRKACELFSGSPTTNIRRNFGSYLKKESADRFYDYLQKIKHTSKQGIEEFDLFIYQKGEYTIELNTVKVNSTTYLTTINDVSGKKDSESELKKAREKALEADLLKANFLSNMSHEIRTPMNSIIGFSELLEMRTTDEKNLEMIKTITKSSRNLLALINDIIDVAKIESNEIKLNNDLILVSDLLSDLYGSFQNEIQNDADKDVQFILNQTFVNSIIQVDSIRLRQVLVNLLSNAIKFTQNGKIELGCQLLATERDLLNFPKLETPCLLFYVKDTGIGISEEKKPIIFERFRQADDSITRKFGGTGLGLAISKGLVELMGGTIWVDSLENQGANFYFTIPYLPYKTTFSLQKNNPKDYQWHGKRFLVVEDLSESARLLSELLSDTHADICFVEDGESAIDFCKKNKVDLILMDIYIPKISGLEATKRIKIFDKEVKIIAQTASVLPELRQQLLEAGCCDVIEKPISEDVLLQTIEKYLVIAN